MESIEMFLDLYGLTQGKKVILYYSLFSLFLNLYIILYIMKQLILPHSTWAIWGGVLSDADEIHVNVETHPLRPSSNKYYYHSERYKRYFGKYNFTIKYPAFKYALINETTKELIYNNENGYYGSLLQIYLYILIYKFT